MCHWHSKCLRWMRKSTCLIGVDFDDFDSPNTDKVVYGLYDIWTKTLRGVVCAH